MLQEIAEQPAVLERTLAAEARKYERLGSFLQSKDIDLVMIVARGSSDNASLFGRYLIEITTGIPVSLAAPSVYTLYNAKLNLSRALVIGVSQSGEGADIIKAAQGGSFKAGNVTGDVGLAPYHDLDSKVPADVKAKMTSVTAAIASGSTKTGLDKLAGTCPAPV